MTHASSAAQGAIGPLVEQGVPARGYDRAPAPRLF